MSIRKSDQLVLEKILRELSVVNDITMRYTKETFVNDTIAQRAAAMTLINIGELTTVFS